MGQRIATIRLMLRHTLIRSFPYSALLYLFKLTNLDDLKQ